MSKREGATTGAKQEQLVAECPACGELVELPHGVKVGSRMACPDCDEPLEVISRKPPELDYAFDFDLEDLDEESEED
jgi:uncharacterized paraquat-inducible protein A